MLPDFEPSPRCGDGVVSPGEACDDGNGFNDDACSNSCAACGDGVVQGDERCDDGNDEAGDGCSACRTPDVAVWTKQIPGYNPRLHPDGRLYTLHGGSYEVKQLDQDGQLLDTWPSAFEGYADASIWASSNTHPLNDGGLLVQVGMGRGVVDAHLARYSSAGALNWVVTLPAATSTAFSGRYTAAMTALGSTIAIAGLEQASGSSSSAFVTRLDPDGLERDTVRYRFMNRETEANTIFVVDDDQVCAGGGQWLFDKDDQKSGWVACWSATLLWERSFDQPVLALRKGDSSTLEVMTTTSWSSLALADGATSNRREGDFGAQYYTMVVAGHSLSSGPNGARLVDPSGRGRWSSMEPKDAGPAGLTADGAAFFSIGLPSTTDSTLYRYETGVNIEVDAEPAPILAAPTVDISQADVGCRDYCSVLAEAGCLQNSEANCLTLCVREATCADELRALGSCLKSQGSVTCRDGGVAQTSGCDAENAAYAACLPSEM